MVILELYLSPLENLRAFGSQIQTSIGEAAHIEPQVTELWVNGVVGEFAQLL